MKTITSLSTTNLYQHYSQILGLPPPWIVKKVDLKLAENLVEIEIIWPPDKQVPCPTCGKLCNLKDHREEREWRHLDTMQLQTIIKSRIPRAKCSEHGTHTIAIPWADSKSHFTLFFEKFAIDVLIASGSIQSAAKLLGITWNQAHDIQSRAVTRGLKDRELEDLKHVGIDEKNFLHGHKYVSLMVDLDDKRVLDVVEGRSLESSNTLWEKIPEDNRQGIEAVAMDMWDAFITSTKTYVPQADIVHDKFHISKYLNESVNTVRRQEHRSFMRDGIETLKGSKYLFLKNLENLTKDEKKDFKELRALNLKAGRAYSIKETFSEFWDYTYHSSAITFFNRWYYWATHSRLKAVISVAKMIKRHLGNILTYLKHHITNAMVEGFNSKIQSIKANARGYRNFSNYRIAILFHCGKLNLYPM